ncbi:hypothetical protein B9479_006472 [Cryptococcus floricola]|uniref:Uncharacterized protein n=1 Tax=Cryptococcus floricola TaxID=2591691 RepID=A0A5D3ANC2_9TREE|nr:hypothetical protein B9479_006472 [Cryptococcus floricola]
MEHGSSQSSTVRGDRIGDPPQSGRQVGSVALGTYDIVTTDYSQANTQGFAQNNPMLPPANYNQYGAIHGGAAATGGGNVDPALYMSFGDGSYAPPTQAGWDANMSTNPDQGGGGYQNNSYGGASSGYAYQYLPPPE